MLLRPLLLLPHHHRPSSHPLSRCLALAFSLPPPCKPPPLSHLMRERVSYMYLACRYVASYGDRIRPLNVSSPLSSSLAGHRYARVFVCSVYECEFLYLQVCVCSCYMYATLGVVYEYSCIGVLGRGSWTPRAQAGRAMSIVMKQRLRSASWKPIDLC